MLVLKVGPRTGVTFDDRRRTGTEDTVPFRFFTTLTLMADPFAICARNPKLQRWSIFEPKKLCECTPDVSGQVSHLESEYCLYSSRP